VRSRSASLLVNRKAITVPAELVSDRDFPEVKVFAVRRQSFKGRGVRKGREALDFDVWSAGGFRRVRSSILVESVQGFRSKIAASRALRAVRVMFSRGLASCRLLRSTVRRPRVCISSDETRDVSSHCASQLRRRSFLESPICACS